jgi:uncharacterized membrane protein
MDGLPGIFDVISKAMQVTGVAWIVISAVSSTARTLAQLARGQSGDVLFGTYRRRLSRGILLGLEFLVGADIIETLVVEPTLQSVGLLGAIVVIRTFLSFTLETEIGGHWPWQRPPGTAPAD